MLEGLDSNNENEASRIRQCLDAMSKIVEGAILFYMTIPGDFPFLEIIINHGAHVLI